MSEHGHVSFQARFPSPHATSSFEISNFENVSKKETSCSFKVYKMIIVAYDKNRILPYLFFPQGDSLYFENPMVYTIT